MGWCHLGCSVSGCLASDWRSDHVWRWATTYVNNALPAQLLLLSFDKYLSLLQGRMAVSEEWRKTNWQQVASCMCRVCAAGVWQSKTAHYQTWCFWSCQCLPVMCDLNAFFWYAVFTGYREPAHVQCWGCRVESWCCIHSCTAIQWQNLHSAWTV